MATHSSVLAWKIPWTEDLGGLPSMGSQKSQTRLGTVKLKLRWKLPQLSTHHQVFPWLAFQRCPQVGTDGLTHPQGHPYTPFRSQPGKVEVKHIVSSR